MSDPNDYHQIFFIYFYFVYINSLYYIKKQKFYFCFYFFCIYNFFDNNNIFYNIYNIYFIEIKLLNKLESLYNMNFIKFKKINKIIITKNYFLDFFSISFTLRFS